MADPEFRPPRKLGKRPPAERPTVEVRQFLRAAEVVPEHPPVNPAPSWSYPMDKNDIAGVCVVASCDHALQTIAHQLGRVRSNWTDDEILRYYQTQNPGFRSWADADTDVDGGMYVQVFLEELVRQNQIVAFGKIDHTDNEVLKAAIYIGLGIVTGSVLQVAQRRQEVWDYVPNSPDWGGHAVHLNGYESANTSCVTWAERVDMTDAFIDNRMDEAWLILTPDMISSPQFRNHFDLRGFSDAVRELTNGKVIVPVPDVPPEPVDPEIPFPQSQLDYWASRCPVWEPKYSREAKTAYRKWRAQLP